MRKLPINVFKIVIRFCFPLCIYSWYKVTQWRVNMAWSYQLLKLTSEAYWWSVHELYIKDLLKPRIWKLITSKFYIRESTAINLLLTKICDRVSSHQELQNNSSFVLAPFLSVTWTPHLLKAHNSYSSLQSMCGIN